jgi:hypothetical protein
MWAARDNGSNVGWSSAHDYCENLRLDGYNDWRLPLLNELQSIYDPATQCLENQTCRLKGAVVVSGNVLWSEELALPGQPNFDGACAGKHWYFIAQRDMVLYREPINGVIGHSLDQGHPQCGNPDREPIARALCVRHARE